MSASSPELRVDSVTGIEVSLPASARALTSPSRPEIPSRGCPVTSSVSWVSAVASSAAARMVTL